MKTITGLVAACLAGRAKTHIYSVFIFWLLILHVNIIFSTLFLDQKLIFEKTHLLKDEYIHNHYFAFSEWWMLLLVEITKIVAAVVATYLTIWIAPRYILARSYRRELEDEYDRKKEKLKKENELEREKKKLAGEQLNTVKVQEQVISQQEQLESKEKRTWEKEYETFKESRMFGEFHKIQESVYRHDGKIRLTSARGDILFDIRGEVVAYGDTNGLLSLVDGRIALTEKGKYFMKRYLENSV